MVLLLAFAFVSGLVTILAPCIWPLLPIILSSSVAGQGHKRPLGITLGIMVSFAIFTLTISYLVMLFHFDPNILRIFAVIVIGFLGLTMIIPSLTQLVELFVSRLSSMWGSTGSTQTSGLPAGRQGFTGGFLTGLSLGIVWSPCAGPILAAIATLAATGEVTFNLVLITIAYVTGVGIPLFVFAYGGQKFFSKTRFISAHTGHIQRVFGVLMILTAVAIYTNYDKVLQAKLLDYFPQYADTLTRFESDPAVKKQLDILKGKESRYQNEDVSRLPKISKAPEFVGISKWLNLPAGLGLKPRSEGRQGAEKALTMAELQGKVVLIDFWTYTCINCIRTLPHVTGWYEKYKDDGLVVVGVHTPEFEFEKSTKNVEDAIARHSITYPVAQDNDYKTWEAYENHYWPAKYLIDKDGYIRYYHFGEGKYEETEQAIQALLKETGSTVSTELLDMPDQTPQTRLSPETYLGSRRMEFLYPNGSTRNGTFTATLSKNIPLNFFSLGGTWTITYEHATSGKNAVLEHHFTASQVFLVMRPPTNGKGTVKVYLDGKLADVTKAGKDVKGGVVTIDSDRLYDLIDLGNTASEHILRLEFDTEGVSAYAFTFG